MTDRLFVRNTGLGPKNSFSRCLVSLVAAILLTGVFSLQAFSQDLDVPYVPTPQSVVNKMLDVTDVGPGDYVIDLGSGDGRIVITAAERGAVGHGVDLDPQRIREARDNARSQNVDGRVLFLQQDIFETDFSQASVITMYLLSSVNRKLRPQLFEQLRPGTRIVSHSFDMGSWQPDETYEVREETGTTHTIYFWIIPADAEGDWNWEAGGRSFSMNVSQQFQEIALDVSSGNSDYTISQPVLKGPRINFIAERNGARFVYSGRIEGDQITGTVQIHSDGDERIEQWSASRR